MMNGVLYEGSEEGLVDCEELFSQRGMSLTQAYEIIAGAKAAAQKSYAPYSHFNVGVAGVFEAPEKSMLIIDGANQENAAYSPVQCGETVAIAQARVRGYHTIRALAVYGMPDFSVDGNIRNVARTQWVAPCGRCRQVINETAADNCIIVFVRGDGQIMIVTFAALFPFAFGPRNLGIDPTAYHV